MAELFPMIIGLALSRETPGDTFGAVRRGSLGVLIEDSTAVIIRRRIAPALRAALHLADRARRRARRTGLRLGRDE